MNYCKIFCCYRCQRQDWTTKSTTRLDLKEAVSSMIFSTQLSRQVQPVYFIKHEVSMYHIYIIYMIYEIYVIHLYIIWDWWYRYTRYIIYIYGIYIYGNQNWTILYQFWNKFRHFKFVFTRIWACLLCYVQ